MPANRTSLELLEPALLEQIKGLSLVARRVVEGTLRGLHRSPFQGLSIEFRQHREYSPGDELKRLDWRVLARSDRYVVKQYEEETNLRAMIFLDCSRSMLYGGQIDPQSLPAPGGNGNGQPAVSAQSNGAIDPLSKFHYARKLAAATAYLMLQQSDSVGLVLANAEYRRQVSPRSAPGHLLSICHALQTAPCSGGTNLPAVLRELAGRLRRRSLVIVVSDLLDDPESVLTALGQLHHRGHDVIVFQVLDPREISFTLASSRSGVTAIRDLETGAEFDAEPDLIRDLVQAEVQKFLQRLDQGARGFGLHLIRATTDEPLEHVLSRYLNYRLHARAKG